MKMKNRRDETLTLDAVHAPVVVRSGAPSTGRTNYPAYPAAGAIIAHDRR